MLNARNTSSFTNLLPRFSFHPLSLFHRPKEPIQDENNTLPPKTVQIAKKTPRPHQTEAINLAKEYFKNHERGKLIMSCGTGKTYTALKIMEQQTNNNGMALFLVPSIALLSQTLKAWLMDTSSVIYPVCICSDKSSSKLDDMSMVDMPLPATTDIDTAIRQINQSQYEQ